MIHWFYGIFAISPPLQISQCENVWIILPLPFYVKSIFGILEAQNLPFLEFQRLHIFILMNFCNFDVWNLCTKNQNSEPSKLSNYSFLCLWICQDRFHVKYEWHNLKSSELRGCVSVKNKRCVQQLTSQCCVLCSLRNKEIKKREIISRKSKFFSRPNERIVNGFFAC